MTFVDERAQIYQLNLQNIKILYVTNIINYLMLINLTDKSSYEFCTLPLRESYLIEKYIICTDAFVIFMPVTFHNNTR